MKHDADESRDPLHDGMSAGFGPAETGPAGHMSILDRIGSRSGMRIGVSLRAEPEAAPAPVLRPFAPGEDRPLATGKYQLQGEIARGGVGVVLRGHDVELGRDVAMKVLHPRHADRPELVERFVEEAQIGGQLQHPGIVPVYDLGLSEERPFFTMKLVKGQTLAALLSERESPNSDQPALLRVFEKVCQTMAYAHARGVIHRDLKPANVMVGAFGEVQVVDWGMGKVLPSGGTADEARAHERSRANVSVIETVRSQPGSAGASLVGSVMGTPAYMPPEQANGDVDRMDERSDVFALGAILCEILTGSPPYVGETEGLIGMAARAELDACFARLDAASPDPELDGLVRDCLRRPPAARPRNADVVSKRLTNYLQSVDQRAETARVEAAEQRGQARSARRAQRLTIGLAASVLVTAAVGLAFGWWILAESRRAESEARDRLSNHLSGINALWGEARGSGSEDLGPWLEAREAVSAAVLAARSGSVPPDQKKAVAALSTRFERELDAAKQDFAQSSKDHRLGEALVRLRIPEERAILAGDWIGQEAARLDREYASAIDAYLGGVDLHGTGTLDDVVRSLKTSAHASQLPSAFLHWVLMRDLVHPPDDSLESRRTQRIRVVATRLSEAASWRTGLIEWIAEPEQHSDDILRIANAADHLALAASDFVLLGEVLWLAGETGRAMEIYRTGRLVHPNDVGLCLHYAIRLHLRRPIPHDEAAGAFRIAYALRPDLPHVLGRLSHALYNGGRLEECALVNELRVRLDPRDGWTRYCQAIALRSLGRFDEALAVGDTTTDFDPGYGHLVLADTLVELERWEEAAHHQRQLVIVNPGIAIHHQRLATTYLELGQFSSARESIQRAAEIREEQIRKGTVPVEYAVGPARRLQELDAIPRIESIVDGVAQEQSIEELRVAARWAHRCRRFPEAFALYTQCIAESEGSNASTKDRYRAARSAVMTGTAEARSWALRVLTGELARIGDSAPLTFGPWLHSPQLSGVRDQLDTLPDAEGRAWRRFWSKVHATLEAARTDPPLR